MFTVSVLGFTGYLAQGAYATANILREARAEHVYCAQNLAQCVPPLPPVDGTQTGH